MKRALSPRFECGRGLNRICGRSKKRLVTGTGVRRVKPSWRVHDAGPRLFVANVVGTVAPAVREDLQV